MKNDCGSSNPCNIIQVVMRLRWKGGHSLVLFIDTIKNFILLKYYIFLCMMVAFWYKEEKKKLYSLSKVYETSLFLEGLIQNVLAYVYFGVLIKCVIIYIDNRN